MRRRLVEDARTKILSGESDFPSIAQRISDANPETGGDLGWIHEDDLAGWMKKSIRTLDRESSLSDVIDMLFGTYENPETFEGEAGFYDGASNRVVDMLLGRDVSEPEAAIRRTDEKLQTSRSARPALQSPTPVSRTSSV